METNYTSNLLLKYLYRETSITQTLEIEHSIENDKETRDYFLRLKAGYKKLPKVQFYPKDKTLSNILSYSAHSPALDCSF